MKVPYVVLDIETIPDQREGAAERAASRVKAPGNYKDPAKIAAYVAEKATEAHASTSLNGAYGELFCIGYKVADFDTVVLSRQDISDPNDERLLLTEFYADLAEAIDQTGWSDPGAGGRQAVFVGHNVIRFDLRFLWQRSVIHDVKPSVRLPYDASPYSDRVVNIGQLWTGDGREYVALDEICDALGVVNPKADGIDGSKVWERVAAGDWQSVIDYNAGDVEATAQVHARMAALLRP